MYDALCANGYEMHNGARQHYDTLPLVLTDGTWMYLKNGEVSRQEVEPPAVPLHCPVKKSAPYLHCFHHLQDRTFESLSAGDSARLLYEGGRIVYVSARIVCLV